MNIIIRKLGLQNYEKVYKWMHEFTDLRNKNTSDEIWFLEHYSVYTQGRAGDSKHILNPNISIFKSDRGGQVTYHAPGQLILYVLIDLNRLNIGIKSLVRCLENIVITSLQTFDVKGHIKKGYPGVYVDNKKICSIGLRIQNGCSLHGISLNINMDLSKFKDINPCGYTNMQMINLVDINATINLQQITNSLIENFIKILEYEDVIFSNALPLCKM